MGIPSYFSYIIKNNPSILKKLSLHNISIDRFYMDCNSVIYDMYYKLINKYNTDNEAQISLVAFDTSIFEEELINAVCDRIHEYIKIINPKKSTYICFDGVAPVAKLTQQKERRYKSSLEMQLKQHYSVDNNTFYWDKTSITPGTKFMKKLGDGVKNYFYRNKNIYISASDEVGEGEHKIFQYIRENKKVLKSETHVIYGLDSDLIMLSICNLSVCNKIYLYRETPEFIKSINADLEPNESYLMDIPNFAQELVYKMNNTKKISCKQEIYRKYDYILMCFMLGNDFLPHFPALNIRYGGIDILINTYNKLFGKTNKNLTDGKKIFWGNFKDFIQELASIETDNIKYIYSIRENLNKKSFNKKRDGSDFNNVLEEKLNKLLNMPVKRRDIEKYIEPNKDYWKERYYESLFGEKRSNEMMRKVSTNYMEGLEWTLQYYSNNCKHWKWRYKYDYPPLLCDLVKFIPSWDCDMIDYTMDEELGDNEPLCDMTQLAYVLPYTSLDLLPDKISKYVLESNICKEHYRLEWSFCRYFWESHVNFDGIDFDELNMDVMELLDN